MLAYISHWDAFWGSTGKRQDHKYEIILRDRDHIFCLFFDLALQPASQMPRKNKLHRHRYPSKVISTILYPTFVV